MRVLLFNCAVLLFMIGLVSLLFLNAHSPTWLSVLVVFSMISGGVSAAILSCVVPERRHEEMEPLKPPEIERAVETL
jgi:multisubunit Na+/H+ antiporter MnhC subunit